MWYQYILQNAHFATNIFAALVFFAVSWLYFDAWSLRKKEVLLGLRTIGFILFSLSYLVHAAFVESSILTTVGVSEMWISILVPVFRIIGYIFIIGTLIADPLQPVPKIVDPYASNTPAKPVNGFGLIIAGISYPVMALITGLLYLHRATTGLERHLKPPAYSFLILAVAELFDLAQFGRLTKNIDLYNLVAPFGLFWVTSHLLLIAAIVIMVRWVFGYLLKRFETQLFIIFTTTIVAIFLIITISFTALLTQNLMQASLNRLATDAKVLSYAIESKKAESLSDAEVVAQDPRIIQAIVNSEQKTVSETASRVLTGKKQSYLIVVNSSGTVVARGEDTERYGDSMSSDSLVILALTGTAKTSITVREGVIAPEIAVRAVAPIKNNNNVVGAVIVGSLLDNTFLDGILASTGLEASLYGGMQLSATTFRATDGVTRPLGITLPGWKVKQQVIDQKKLYTGAINLLNRPYYASFMPLIDHNDRALGMVSVAEPQIAILATAGRSIELTFLIAIVLLALSVFPSYFISQYITKQI